MELRRKPIQIYAILICVVAIITMIINISAIAVAVIDKSNPLLASYSGSELSSLEAYKMEMMKSSSKDAAYLPDDEAVSIMYEAAKQDKINRVLHQANRSILVNSLVGAIALFLFISHWFLMKKSGKGES